MAQIIRVGTAVPTHRYAQSEIRSAVYSMFADKLPHLEKMLTIFDNSGIESRHLCQPLEWYSEPHSFRAKQEAYVEAAVKLGGEAILDCLTKAGLDASEIDHVITVSTTGIATPSLEAYWVNQLGMRSDVLRTPIWGLGCAGGAVGLSRACQYVRVYPESLCLLVSVELCSLALLLKDTSKSNLVATSLFADGAAAVLIAGDDWVDRQLGRRRDEPILSYAGSRSHLWPDSLDVMGWEFVDEGLKVIFSRDIPALVRQEMRGNVVNWLQHLELSLSEIDHYVLHPGGRKVLEAYEEALELQPEQLLSCYQVLSRYGNMSSATILFVLDEWLNHRALNRVKGAQQVGGQAMNYALFGALGPGFSSELLLFRLS